MTAATSEAPVADAPGPGLHQPLRAAVAAGEVVLAVALVALAVWCWNRGVLRYSYPVENHAPLESTRYLGNWVGGALGLGTVAGVLLLDAVRQLLLAVRTRGREKVAEPDV
ncbi:hypothetical protein ABZ816_11855 [Actinosynnema sp. NPDC047251]|uniref:Putative membrane protein n=1 Tax=Saccharothrix espanaensis (strain ATCC 51144 / DSM 44229 / JCM 9112 / NBRC 15066 / NRRL 15764) TaxID=1179773 RepID=K0KAF2_SACES|nr:hypothetical protein [Saccharothrix espanaensis]CCH35291.1 putative membrane protein [Saccharothrix espanaensis DSM 44229]